MNLFYRFLQKCLYFLKRLFSDFFPDYINIHGKINQNEKKKKKNTRKTAVKELFIIDLLLVYFWHLWQGLLTSWCLYRNPDVVEDHAKRLVERIQATTDEVRVDLLHMVQYMSYWHKSRVAAPDGPERGKCKLDAPEDGKWETKYGAEN